MFEKKINPSFKKTVNPFQIDIFQKKDVIEVAVAYHSGLFGPMTFSESALKYKRIEIVGLDKTLDKITKKTAMDKNYYVVLKIKVNNLKAESAEIKVVESDKNEKELDPVKFDSAENLKQTEANVILGVIVHDGGQYAATLSTDQGGIETFYLIQFVNTNLIMANMVMDGIPIVYPVPISGGRLNF
jgi:hypothetical protein